MYFAAAVGFFEVEVAADIVWWALALAMELRLAQTAVAVGHFV